jgi:hypothetical protein
MTGVGCMSYARFRGPGVAWYPQRLRVAAAGAQGVRVAGPLRRVVSGHAGCAPRVVAYVVGILAAIAAGTGLLAPGL